MRARAGPRTAFLERNVKIGAGSLHCRNQPEQDAGNKRQHQGEDEHPPIGRDGGAIRSDARDIARVHGQQRAHAQRRDRQAQNATDRGKQQAFGEQLADNAAAPGADGGSDGDLAGAAHGACQQQAGDVGAGDQEQAAYRAQQNVERCAHVAHQKLLHGLNREAHLGIRGAWVPAFELLAGQVEGGFG